jgi:DNA-binding LacI/PurR family transcriptional regulator
MYERLAPDRSELPSISARPAERVLSYLTAEGGAAGLRAGERLPSVRQLAKRLQVSTATVQSVFQKLAEEGRIRSEVGNGSFWAVPPEGSPEVLRIGVNLPLLPKPALSVWLQEIYGGMLHALLRHSRPVVLRPVSAGAASGDLDHEEVEGLIIFPGPGAEVLHAKWAESGVPFIHLNPPSETATSDFVSPDYYGASRHLGSIWEQTNRQRILLLMSPSPDLSVSVRLRCGGMVAGLGEAMGNRVQLRIHRVDSGVRETGYETIREYFSDGSFRPDAVYCAGDALAQGVLEALAEAGVDVPREVSVVGGNGLGLAGDPLARLTAMRQPLTRVGEALVERLLQRIESGGASLPGVFLPIEFAPGDSTRSCENDRLGAVAGLVRNLQPPAMVP